MAFYQAKKQYQAKEKKGQEAQEQLGQSAQTIAHREHKGLNTEGRRRRASKDMRKVTPLVGQSHPLRTARVKARAKARTRAKAGCPEPIRSQHSSGGGFAFSTSWQWEFETLKVTSCCLVHLPESACSSHAGHAAQRAPEQRAARLACSPASAAPSR